MPTPDAKRMEKMRELQTELGGILDRYYADGGTPGDVMAILSVESELWLRRDSETAKVDPHLRAHAVGFGEKRLAP
jgi:hypothetical protein